MIQAMETERGKPNHLAVPGGLHPDTAIEAIGLIKEHFEIEACAIVSYDPEFDEGKCVLNAGFK